MMVTVMMVLGAITSIVMNSIAMKVIVIVVLIVQQVM